MERLWCFEIRSFKTAYWDKWRKLQPVLERIWITSCKPTQVNCLQYKKWSRNGTNKKKVNTTNFTQQYIIKRYWGFYHSFEHLFIVDEKRKPTSYNEFKFVGIRGL